MEGGGARVVFEDQPFTPITFNRFMNSVKIGVGGAGNFVPVLEVLNKLISKINEYGTPVALFFLTDGYPSDEAGPGQGTQASKLIKQTSIIPLC